MSINPGPTSPLRGGASPTGRLNPSAAAFAKVGAARSLTETMNVQLVNSVLDLETQMAAAVILTALAALRVYQAHPAMGRGKLINAAVEDFRKKLQDVLPR